MTVLRRASNASGREIDVLVVEPRAGIVGKTLTHRLTRCRSLVDYEVVSTHYDPRSSRADSAIVLGRGPERLDVGSRDLIINLGIPSLIAPPLSESDADYAADESRAAWLAVLECAVYVANRPRAESYWIVEAAPSMQRRVLHKQGIATVSDRVLSGLALASETRATHVAAVCETRAAPRSDVTVRPDRHYYTYFLDRMPRFVTIGFAFGKAIAFEYLADELQILDKEVAADGVEAAERTTRGVCHELSLDLAFVTYILCQEEALLSLISLDAPANLTAPAADVLSDAILRQFARGHNPLAGGAHDWQ